MKRRASTTRGATTSPDYAPLLRQWSRELLASELAIRLAVKTDTSDWLGSNPASPESIAAIEARLGVALPPSYRQFLLTSDGWGPLSAFVHRLRPCAEVDWFITENRSVVDVWEQTDDGGATDVDYYSYTGDNPYFRGEHLRHSLQIADHGDGDLLLNPRAVTADGEWECWFLASWIPGVQRYPSFAHWLLAAYDSFRKCEGVTGDMPPTPALAALPPGDKRKVVKPKRHKPTPRSLEDLIAAADSTDAAERTKAVKELAGRLALRAASDRRPDLIEPLTHLFRKSPDTGVRSACVQLITQLAPDGPTPPAIIEAFADHHPWVVVAATFARHYFDLSAAFDAICTVVDTMPDAMTRDAAISTLGHLADPRAIPVLNRALRDATQSFNQIFGTAALAMAACGAESAPALFAALADADPRVRLAAVVGADQLDDPRALERLRPMLDDDNEDVRTRAGFAVRKRSSQ